MDDVIDPWVPLRDALVRGDKDALARVLDELPSGELARAMAHLDPREQSEVLRLLDVEDAADLLSQLSRVQVAELVQHLDPDVAAGILHELSVAEGADIVRDLDRDEAEAVLAALPVDEANAVRRIAAWDDDVAGGLMTTEFLAVPARATIGQVVETIRRGADTYSSYDVQYIYVVDDDGVLEGVLPLRRILLTPADAPVVEVMIPSPRAVEATTDLDTLVEEFDDVDFFALPVVHEGRLVGVVRRAAVMEAVGEEAAQEHLKASGIVGGDELRSMPLRVRSLGRLKWLSVNIGLNVVAASVIATFQQTLQAVVALAVFLPIISDMSGCSGNQAVAVSMRELSLGVATPRDVLHVWGKELAVGVVNGTALGLLLGVVGTLWMGNPWLGLVAGVALAVNTLIAVSIGGTVPLLAKRLGFDPALASGPVLTTITDVCGFALVLGIATALLPKLVA